MKVLVGCEYSGIVRDAFSRKGHDAWSCDLLSTKSDLTNDSMIGDIECANLYFEGHMVRQGSYLTTGEYSPTGCWLKITGDINVSGRDHRGNALYTLLCGKANYYLKF